MNVRKKGNDMTFYINNEEIPQTDRSITLGDAVFDTLLVKNATPLFITEHIDRIISHAHILKIKNIPSKEEIISQINNIVKSANPLKKYSLRTTITRGSGARGLAPANIQNPSIIIKMTELTDIPPPAKLWISRTTRRNEYSPTSKIKTTNYADNILALIEAKENNANEAILLNTKNNISCISSGNIYIIENNNIYTPPIKDGVMNGVIRSKLIEKYSIKEETISEERLKKANYIFTSNSISIRPVIELDNKKITPPDLSFIEIY